MAGLCRFALPLFVAVLLTACADRPGPSALQPVQAGGGRPIGLLVATNRGRVAGGRYDTFDDKRTRTVNYERYTISIPPGHKDGNIEWPSEFPGNPARDMVVLNSQRIGPTQIGSTIAAISKDHSEVYVFVHGFNNNYQEAVYRAAQLGADANLPGAMTAFIWPSRGAITGYVADRESTTQARDYLEDYLNELARTPGVKTIHILSHSMGNWLTLEVLRQAKLRAHSPFLAKLGEVFIVSPDVDVDVFRTQLDVIGRLRTPMTILISSDDRALAASQRLAGDVPRVGNVDVQNARAIDVIRKYNLRVIDISQVSSLDSLRHTKFVTLLPKLDLLGREDKRVRSGNPINRAGAFAADAAGNIIFSPLRLGQKILDH